MAYKKDIPEVWARALENYDKGNFKDALRSFMHCGPDAKTLFNMGLIHATLGEHDAAVQAYRAALTKDAYLAIAHFQQGVSNYLVSNFDEALNDFTHALRFLRENLFINYEPFGLNFCLYRCEILFNRGLCYNNLLKEDKAIRNLTYASREKMKNEHHSVIDEALKTKGEGFTVFSIPVGTIFRCADVKERNIKPMTATGLPPRKGSLQTTSINPPMTGPSMRKGSLQTTMINLPAPDGLERKRQMLAATHTKTKSVDVKPSQPPVEVPQRSLTTMGKAKLLPKRSLSKLRGKSSSSSSSSSSSGSSVYSSASSVPSSSSSSLSSSSSDESKSLRSALSSSKPRPPPINSVIAQPSQTLTAKKSFGSLTAKTPSDRGMKTPSDRGLKTPGERNLKTPGEKPPMKSPFAGIGLPGRTISTKKAAEESSRIRAERSPLPTAFPPISSPSPNLTRRREEEVAKPFARVPPTPKQTQDKRLPTIPSPQIIGGQFRTHAPHEHRRHKSSPTTSVQFFSGLDEIISAANEDDGDYSDDDIPDYYGSEWSGRSRSSWATSVEECPEDQAEIARKLKRRTVIVHLTKIKLKMHHEDDLVAIMIPPDIDYKEFMRRVRDKLKMDRNGKVKFKDDDGLQILLADQEDLDQAIDTCERMAKKADTDFGKMEIWVS
ncbi:hypothetical protein TWF694_004062 [Orbilia ellipsospora]|uniref:PB1 domain-containing protein n=1 Tax=Orbilia ellipsospora TaxID=2528407 RepID=A0AAV9WXS3_9PEZI